MCFDTGAFHSVTPRGIFPGAITSSPMSRAGKKYRGPDNSRIPNLGMIDGRWLDELGAPCGLPWQVADIATPLMAGTQVTAGGNTVVLKESGGSITNDKTGRVVQIHKRGDAEGGVYIIKMWVPIGDTPQPGFPRQGRA